MENRLINEILLSLAQSPDAESEVVGSSEYDTIRGVVSFQQTPFGVLVTADFSGLPFRPWLSCDRPVFGFHIHEGESCTGTSAVPFADTGGHYNPGNCPHPAHAGDLPPLFANRGRAWMTVLTDRFQVRDVLNRTVILHRNPDDFTTQPSGNSGMKIACGVILPRRS